jgi:YHS domain-containing protein
MKPTLLLAAIAMIAAPLSLRAADTAKPYALDICLISGEKIGEMGKPTVVTYEGQEIKLCCGSCKKAFDKDPAAVVKKYNAAVASKSSGGKSN